MCWSTGCLSAIEVKEKRVTDSNCESGFGSPVSGFYVRNINGTEPVLD